MVGKTRVTPLGRNGAVLVVVPWQLYLKDKHEKSVGSGIKVGERIEWSKQVSFNPTRLETASHETTNGWVRDPWTLPFTGPNGQVTTKQTIFAAGREATLSATVHANGEVDAQLWAPFH
jgi:hypothetical protein